MPTSPYTHAVQVTAAAATLAVETVIATSNILPLSSSGGEGYKISGVVNFTEGTNGTAVTLRVRQGTLTGTLVGVGAVHTLAAAAVASIPYSVVDTAAATSPPAGGVYVLTAQQTAATANGTANIATLEVTAVTSES